MSSFSLVVTDVRDRLLSSSAARSSSRRGCRQKFGVVLHQPALIGRSFGIDSLGSGSPQMGAGRSRWACNLGNPPVASSQSWAIQQNPEEGGVRRQHAPCIVQQQQGCYGPSAELTTLSGHPLFPQLRHSRLPEESGSLLHFHSGEAEIILPPIIPPSFGVCRRYSQNNRHSQIFYAFLVCDCGPMHLWHCLRNW